MNLLRRPEAGRLNPTRTGILGALAGTGAGVGGSYLLNSGLRQAQRELGREKLSFYLGGGEQDATATIVNALMGDMSVPQMTKLHMVNLVQMLRPNEASALSGLLRRGVGASAGFLIAHYLMKLNLGGALVASLIGGALAGPSVSRTVTGFQHF